MNKTVLLLGAVAAFLYVSSSASAATPGTATQNAGGPVFPAPNPNALADIPAGETVYVSNDGVRYWHYLDPNGFDHYVVGLLDVGFITNEASITMNRRTGAKSSNDSDRRPTLTPLAVNISLNGLKELG